MKPGQVIFEITPETLNGIKFWTIGRQKDQAYVVWNAQVLGRMTATVIQHHQIERIGIGTRKGIDEDLEVDAIELRQFQQEVFPARWRNRTIEIEVLEIVLGDANGVNTTGGQAPSADGA